MACKQIFIGRLTSPNSNADRYIGPTFAKYEWTATLVGAPWQVDGAFNNLAIELLSAPGAGNSLAFTLVKNGSDTALTVTISDSSTTGTSSSSVSVVAGDLLYWRVTPTSLPTVSNVRASVEFNGTTANESGYASLIDINTTQTWRGSVFMAGQWNTSNVGVGAFEVVGAAGNITELSYVLSTAPGSTDSYEFVMYKNGTKQDGAGGTTDTRTTITGSATTGSWTGSLAVSPGDLVILEAIPTGGPVSSTVGYASKFVATTDGESQFCATVFTNLPTSGGPYYAKPHWSGTGWTTTEADHTTASGSTNTVLLKNMRVRLGSTVAIGPVNFALRANGADAGPTITLTSGQQTGSDLSNTHILALADLIAFRYTPTASPGGATIAGIGMVMFATAAPPPIENVAIFGSNTTVKYSNVVAFGMDGATNVCLETGRVQIYGNLGISNGYIGLMPIAEPTPPTGEAAIYIDIADGDLKIKFANGTVDVIATN